MMEYNENSKVYRVFDPERRKIVITRDIVCNESKLGLPYLSIASVPNELYFSSSLTDSLLNGDNLNGPNPASNLKVPTIQTLLNHIVYPAN